MSDFWDKTPECIMCGVKGSEPMTNHYIGGKIRHGFRCVDQTGCNTRAAHNLMLARLGLL